MKIVIGAPVRSREWIIKDWMDHAVAAAHQAGADPEFLLVLSPDDPTYLVSLEHAKKRGFTVDYIFREERQGPDARVWNHERYHEMVELRNILLEGVREKNPDYFLSLDTDILVHPLSIFNLVKDIKGFDAIGGKLFMTVKGNNFPSYAFLSNNGLKRPDSKKTFEVDVIMAMKLMTHAAYNIDYVWARQGEDIGWSTAAREAGLKLGWSGLVTNKHIMTPLLFGEVDPRCGY